MSGMRRDFGVRERYFGYQEWTEQFKMCWAVMGGKGSVRCGFASVMFKC